jgi:hypothetical protein
MGAFARLDLALRDVDDKTADLIYAAFAPAAPGVRPPSVRRMRRATKLALALLDSRQEFHQFPQIQRGKADARQRPRKPGQSVKR